MYQFFVYLIKSQNRLVILRQKVENFDYQHLMDNNGGDVFQLEHLCKTFCLGYILGAQNGKKPINSLYEFQ
jgi:hypothetical protein